MEEKNTTEIEELKEEIRKLKEEIEGYKNELAVATDRTERSEIRGLITTRSNNLTELQQQLRRLQQPPEIISTSRIEMTCNITVVYGDVRIELPVIVDSGCQEEFSLEPIDAEALNLPQIGQREVGYPDGSIGNALIYANVTVEVHLSDGSVVQASVVPVSFEKATERVGVECTERILGYPALDKLNLKLDFKAKKLTKRIRRI